MLTSCLIFLLTGVFITCRPTTSRPLEKPPSQFNKEIQEHLKGIIRQSPVAKNLNTTTLHIAAFSTKEECALSRLRALIKLLEPVKIDGNEGLDVSYQKLCKDLKFFEKSWPSQENSDKNCETKKYTPKTLIRVLRDIETVMKELYCIQEDCYN